MYGTVQEFVRGEGVSADDIVGQELEGHEPSQANVPSLVNHAHSAAAQPFDDAVCGRRFDRSFLRSRSSRTRQTSCPHAPSRNGARKTGSRSSAEWKIASILSLRSGAISARL